MRIPLHPLLVALYPIAAVFSANVAEVPIRDLVFPAEVVVFLTAVLWFTGAALGTGLTKRALAISLFWAAFFGYGPVEDALEGILGTRGSSAELVSLICVGGMAGAAGLWIIYAPGGAVSLRKVSGALTIAAGAALGIASTSGWYQWKTNRDIVRQITEINAAAFERARTDFDAAPARDSPPNVYFVVLDAYGRADALGDFYGIDNSPFTGFLQRSGFRVIADASSHYPLTVWSLASTLNCAYLNESMLVDPEIHLPPGAGLIQQNSVVQLFRMLGYSTVAFATGFAATELEYADVYVAPRFAINDFDEQLIQMSVLRIFDRRLAFVLRRNELANGDRISNALHRARVLTTIGWLENPTVELREPAFVFAHIVCPHVPFVFDFDGKPMNHPELDWERQDVFRDRYARQVRFIEDRVEKILTSIVARDPEAVIILQGDHGARSLQTQVRGQTPEGRADYERDWLGILNAVRMPGVDLNSVPANELAPVNVFRFVLNTCLGQHFEYLPYQGYLFASAGGDRPIPIREVAIDVPDAFVNSASEAATPRAEQQQPGEAITIE